MARIFLFLIALAIILIDLRVHKIHNVSLLMFAFPLSVNPNTTSREILSISIALIILFGFLSRMGAGDIKLLILLVSLQGALMLTYHYLLGLLFISIAHIMIEIMSKRHIPARLPFAPSILIPFLWRYLGI